MLDIVAGRYQHFKHGAERRKLKAEPPAREVRTLCSK